MATPDVSSVIPYVLPRDVVRSVFPVDQSEPFPGLSELPELSWRWNFQAIPATPVVLSYAFSSTAPDYDPGDKVNDPNSYAAYTPEEEAIVASALAAYAAVAGLTFELVADPHGAQIVFRKADLVPGGFAFYPPYSSASAELPLNGDVYLDIDSPLQPYIVFHEIGHALGLAHPYEAGRPHPEDFGFDGGRHLSVVDQRPVEKPYYLIDTGSGYTFTSIFDPTTPMPLDILALQMLYGQNTITNSGDTAHVYELNPNFYQTIWDAGGIDTIDLSNQTNPNLVSLVDGTYSSIGLRDPFAGVPDWAKQWALSIEPDESLYNDGSNLLAIAFDAIIENAIGGSAGDRLLGNSADNQLAGRGGDDTLVGEGGDDTLSGETGADVLTGGIGADVFVFESDEDRVDRVTDFDFGDAIVVESVSLSGQPAQGDGSGLLFGEVDFLQGSSTATVYIGLDGIPGSDLEVLLDGSFAVARFRTIDGRLEYVPLPSVSIAATDASRNEGDAGSIGFTFTVSRSGDTSGVSSANWAVSGAAVSAADFVGGVLPSGTLNFAAGETSKLITVPVAGDTAVESDETFTVSLSNPSGATLGTSTANGTILNDDGSALVGTPNPDSLIGTAYADTIVGLGSNDSMTGAGGSDTIDGGEGVDYAIWTRPSSQYSLGFSAGQYLVTDKSGLDGTDSLTSVERLQFADKTVIVDAREHDSYADLPVDLYHFFIVAFNAAPGVQYMNQLAEAYRWWTSDAGRVPDPVRTLVEVFTTKQQFTDVYPTTLSDHDLAVELVAQIVKSSADSAAKQEAVNDIEGALGIGWTRGQVIYTVFGNLAHKPFDDATWGGTARQFENEIAVAKYYTEVLNQSTTDLPTLRDALQPVGPDTDVSTPEVIATLIGVALMEG